MLKITPSMTDRATILKLEGVIRDGWLDEIRIAVAQAATLAAPIHLDLSQVTYSDNSGIALLRELRHSGITLHAGSGFIAVSLGMES